jgi:hypothetical protein
MGVWGSDEIMVDMTAGRVAVRGPVEFVTEIDWPRVEAVALLLAQALGPVDALKVALWREYRGWRRRLPRSGQDPVLPGSRSMTGADNGP